MAIVEDKGMPTSPTWALTGVDPEGLVPQEVPTGTLVLLNGMLPHGSEPSRAERSRHAHTLHLTDARSDWPEDNWLQRPPDFPSRGC
ncbi:MAG TPA: hypothetical protein ENI86_04065 [Acidimicrobiales bacterium]|nr:hypothetical protein [Acidimicrobiales bacterium]